MSEPRIDRVLVAIKPWQRGLPLEAEHAGQLAQAAGITDPDVIDMITWKNACRFYDWDPFQHTPKEQASVGALRALATDVDTSTTTKAQYRERYLASASAGD